MKTTVVIDDELMKEAMRAARVRTKREAIELGLRELVRRRNIQELREELGTYDIDLTPEQLERLRDEP